MAEDLTFLCINLQEYDIMSCHAVICSMTLTVAIRRLCTPLSIISTSYSTSSYKLKTRVTGKIRCVSN